MKTMKHLAIALAMAIVAALAVAYLEKRLARRTEGQGIERFKMTIEYEKKAEPGLRDHPASALKNTAPQKSTKLTSFGAGVGVPETCKTAGEQPRDRLAGICATVCEPGQQSNNPCPPPK